jgi:hypothetical protein
MGKKLYYTLVIMIGVITAGIFYIASVINLPEQFSVQERSVLRSWVFVGIAASVIVVILAGIADRQKDTK